MKPKFDNNQLAKVIVELSTQVPVEESCYPELYVYLKKKNEQKKEIEVV